MAKKDKIKSVNSVAKKSSRPPIVAVLGHVDHGKTTLLDSIRKTKVQGRETGGITQGIGASQVKTKEGKTITFIDTPGHAAFSKMRSRGAKVADIAILVIGANDGVKPQTRETLAFIKEEGLPFIVAITKIDLPSISIEDVKKELGEEGVKLEGAGGDVPVVELSGKTGKGIDSLLEMISLVSEMSEIEGSADSDLETVVIETNKDKRGPLVSGVVRNGKLKVGDEILAGKIKAKARGLFDQQGKPVEEVAPGDPVMILGFKTLPSVGTEITNYKDGQAVSETSDLKRAKTEKVASDEKPVVIKAKSEGALEAVLGGIPEKIKVIYSGVGDVNENDVFVAKSAEPPAKVFVFESKIPNSVSNLAKTEGVSIERFEIIYKLFEKLEEILKEGATEVLGEAGIVATFPFNKKRVAGTKVTKGRINRSDKLTIMRGDKKIGDVRIASMRRGKEKINQAKEGEELGLIFRPKLDFEVGDMILSATNVTR